MSSKKPSKTARAPRSAKGPKPAGSQKEEKEVKERGAFPIVGVGASAGGLAAIEQFLSEMPATSGMAFVIITHQHAGRPSLMRELLSRKTAMPIIGVTEPTRVVPNHVYLPPPGYELAILDSVLCPMATRPSSALHLPIDYFFRSLAQDQKEMAIGIVLSGTGVDGTLGVKEIKARLGLVLVQDAKSAQYNGMPNSAIGTGLADYVLAPAEMPARLVRYAKGFGGSRSFEGPDGEALPEAFRQVFVILRTRTGHDFAHYKVGTLSRRIKRRMNVHQIESVKDYVRFLQERPTEIDLLFQELLIGVTAFFRDGEAFSALKTRLTELLADKPDGYVVRGWIAGCSTGEEAYSIAILVRECLEESNRHVNVQLFATDLDAEAIAVARVGIYPGGVSDDLSPARLTRFFTREDDRVRVKKEIRDMLVFAPQNIISDPPFTKLDLLACRNVLIYLDSRLQKKLIPLFHYALKPGGILFLGSSESVGSFPELFKPVDKQWKIYRSRDVPNGALASPIPTTIPDHLPDLPRAVGTDRAGPNLTQLTQRLLLKELVPPTVLVREDGEVVMVHGRTGLFLEPAQGPQASANIFKMAREGLELPLAATMRRAATDAGEVFRRGVRVKTNNDLTSVDLRVRCIREPEPLHGLFLISFEHTPAEAPGSAAPRPHGKTKSGARVIALERELQHVKEVHQGTIEELETINEELKSANEELQSTNEEMQSTNEEIETSKEEMQSLNEELQTVNAELQVKVDELSRANDDMKNLLNGTDIATIFLDNELNIKRYTEQARSIIPLIPTDVGRSIGDLGSSLRYDRLVEDAQQVLDTLIFREKEVLGEKGNWYLMRILPYRTTENVIDGLVLTFVDITKIKSLRESQLTLLNALSNSATSVFGQDREMRFLWAFGSVFGRSPEDLLGKTEAALLGAEQMQEFTVIKEGVLGTGVPIRQRARVKVGDILRVYDVYVEPTRSSGRQVDGVCCVVTDVTSFK